MSASDESDPVPAKDWRPSREEAWSVLAGVGFVAGLAVCVTGQFLGWF